MSQRPDVVARAFEMARSGQYSGVTAIKRALKREQYLDVAAHLDGASMNRQLRQEMELASQSPSQMPGDTGRRQSTNRV